MITKSWAQISPSSLIFLLKNNFFLKYQLQTQVLIQASGITLAQVEVVPSRYYMSQNYIGTMSGVYPTIRSL